MRKFAETNKVGFCFKPKDFDGIRNFAVPKKFMAPSRLDLRDRCTPTEDQGGNPMCAAYSAAQWAENIRWMLTGSPLPEIDPIPLYRYAKTVDGEPNEDGTTITAVLEALLSSQESVFDRTKCRVRTIRPSRIAIKHAIHKFGCCLGGFAITDEWFDVTDKNNLISGDGEHKPLGGHCVLVCGYDKQGVWVQNSWGWGWGEYGFAKVSWKAFDSQFMYGGVITNVLDGMTLG